MAVVVVLGGAGAMARPALDILSRRHDVTELVVADRRAADAATVAVAIGGIARSASVDVTDAVALRRLLEPADLVLNTTGSFFRLAAPVLRAAIDTATHYIDICDDWEPIEELFALDDQARYSAVTAIVGMGASPGLSNLLAALAAASSTRCSTSSPAGPSTSISTAAPARRRTATATTVERRRCIGCSRSPAR